MSYVFTCSSQFQETIKAILKSLQDAGFSGRDYLKQQDYAELKPSVQQSEMDFFKPLEPSGAVKPEVPDDTPEIDVDEIQSQLQTSGRQLDDMMKKAEQAEQEYAEQTERLSTVNSYLPNEVQDKMNDKTYGMRSKYADDAKALKLPRFVIEVKTSLFFGKEKTVKTLDQADLMRGFKLTAEDKKIVFETSQSESQMITLDERNKDEWVPMAAETPAVCVPTVERGLRFPERCSMAIVGGRPSMKSHSGFFMRPRN